MVKQKLKILMISLDFPPTVGGISAHVYELSKALVNEGHHVTVLSKYLSHDEEVNEQVDGVKIVRYKIGYFGFLYGFFINRAFHKINKNLNFDVVHVHGIRPLEFLNTNIPLVFTNHTSGFLKRIKKSERHISKLKKLFKKIDMVLAPSNELLNIPFHIRGIKKFIPNGVDLTKFINNRDNRGELRKKLGFKDEDVVAILTRRLVWKNGVNYLAESTKYIKNKKLKILFIGDGEERQDIENKLEKYFAGRYFFLGSMKHADIIDFYSAADFSILPSLMEATSISGLEAMASGLPLVGTKVGGIPNLIHDGKNGFLCEPADAEDLAIKIDKLIDGDYKQMGQTSLQIVKDKYDWRKIAKKTINAYYEVLTK